MQYNIEYGLCSRGCRCCGLGAGCLGFCVLYTARHTTASAMMTDPTMMTDPMMTDPMMTDPMMTDLSPSSCAFGRGKKNAIDPSHRPGARRWAPGYSAGALPRAARHLPHTRALACFICQPNPNQKHLNPIPEIDCFDPMPACCCWHAALRVGVGVACSALWPVVVLAHKLWAQTQTPTHPEPKHNHRH
jgi:hypothetical protein